jgi:hypothetical protein
MSEEYQRPPHTHRPEFIFIDTERPKQRRVVTSEEPNVFVNLRDVHYKWYVRVVALLWAFCLWLLTALTLAAVCCLALGTLVTLGYYQPIRTGLTKTYQWCCKIAVLALGFSVAVLSPSFGMAIIFVYFTLLGEELDRKLFYRFMRSRGEDQTR